jgi:exodeoxyribonuclease VII large subunit
MPTAPAPDAILSVGELTRRIRGALEDSFSGLWVRGELSGFKRSDRGHLYFALKEGTVAVLDGVMWKGTAGRLGFEPRDGMQVEAYGSITVYEPRGRYQLVIEEMRPAGLGALLLALEELKQKLAAEGLFDAARKRALPRFPHTVGLVTSPTGAAVRDLVKVLRGRWPGVRIVLAPVRVQGEGAAAEIAAAIQRFDRWGGADVLIVGRGGGSLEDLWAFNEEPVVRAVAASRTPTISAVGHEVDFTLCDLAADVRAATPSNAAELAVRDRREVAARVEALSSRATRGLLQGLADRRRLLERLLDKYGFKRQSDAVRLHQRRVDELVERSARALRGALVAARERLDAVARRYGLREWPRVLIERREQVGESRERLTAALVDGVHARRTRLGALGDRMRALSPRAVMERGYALVKGPQGTLVRAADGLAAGELLTIEFARGEADARIEAVRRGGAHGEEDHGR